MARLATLVPARVPVSEAVIGCVLEVCPETGVGLIAAAVGDLPPIHRDPLDRILIAQSAVEGIALLTHDPVVARYGGLVRAV